MANSRKKYRRKSNNARQTPAQHILSYLLEMKKMAEEGNTKKFDVGRRYSGMPYNAFTGHQYAGFHNVIMLTIAAIVHGYTDPRFVTMGKAKEIGANFKGQKSTMLWAPVPVKKKDEETDEDKIVGIRFHDFRVFNVDQLANKDELDIPPLQRATWGDLSALQRLEAVKKHALKNFKQMPEFKEDGMVVAPHYRSHSHTIVLPPTNQYESIDLFAQSLIHEIMHATGAESELKRFKKQEADFHSSDASYAFEEMVAQFSTAYLLVYYQFDHDAGTSADYALGWSRRIENEPELFEKVITEAMAVIRHTLKDNPLPSLMVNEEISSEEKLVILDANDLSMERVEEVSTAQAA